MKTTRDIKRRGSSILLVIGLLVLMAMIACTFLIVVHVDRQEAASIESVSPLRHVAAAGLQRVLAERLADLYIGAGGPFDALDKNKANEYYKVIDYAGSGPEGDPGLSSGTCVIKANDPSGKPSWHHLTDLAGVPVGVSYDDVTPDNPGLFSTTGFPRTLPDGSVVGYGDAVPFYSGINDLGGRQYWLALRVEDLCGRLNVNMGGTRDHNSLFQRAARVGVPMRVTDQLLYPVVGTTNSDCLVWGRIGTAAADNVYYDSWWANYVRRPLNPNGRPGALGDATITPYATPDMLMCGWGGGISGNPDTSFGPLHWAVAFIKDQNLVDKIVAARRYLTVWSGDGILVPQYAGNLPQKVKADLNNSPLEQLYAAFYNALPPADPADPVSKTEDERRRIAGQLAVNVIDFRDTDNSVTVAEILKFDATHPDTGNPTYNNIVLATTGNVLGGSDRAVDAAKIGVYGVERQPFITKLFYKATKDNGTPPVITKSYSAIELYNPYVTEILLDNYALKVGAKTILFPAGKTISGNRGKFVIRGASGTLLPGASDINNLSPQTDGTNGNTAFKPTDVTPTDPSNVLDSSDLDLAAADVKIVRRRNITDAGSMQDVVIATKPSNFPSVVINAGQTGIATWEWDDVRTNARCAVGSLYVISANDYTTASPPDKLGANNKGVFATIAAKPPCPVFVRNDKFINSGEMFRLLAVGPSASQGLADRLTNDGGIFNGRLSLEENVSTRKYPGPPDNGNYPAGLPIVPTVYMMSDYVTVNSPAADGFDSDADGRLDDMMYGRININTTSEYPLYAVPGIFKPAAAPADLDGVDPDTTPKAAANLMAYRDMAWYGHPWGNTNDFRPPSEGGANYRSQLISGLRTGRGFASVGEAISVIRKLMNPVSAINNNYGGIGDTYRISDSSSDDGLTSAAWESPIKDDVSKYYSNWAWASDHLTVRSDTYLAYVAVLGSTGRASGTFAGGLTDASKSWNKDEWKGYMVVNTDGSGKAATVTGNGPSSISINGNLNPGGYQIMHLQKRYMAVIDRSNCRTTSDTPRVLMFAEIK